MTFSMSTDQKYTAIWQAQKPDEEDWIKEILGILVSEYVTDGKHEVVLENAILIDAFICSYDPAYYGGAMGKNALPVHLLDEGYVGPYDIYNNFRGVIRCFWSDIFDQRHVKKMPLGYCRGMGGGRSAALPATQRGYVWSFVGQTGKATRPDADPCLGRRWPKFRFVNRFPRSRHLDQTPMAEGRSCLASRGSFPNSFPTPFFAPCPMGNVNIECFRTYEVLERGAIPIVEKRWGLDYYHNLLGNHPMPTARPWSEARRMVQAMMKNGDRIDRDAAGMHRVVGWVQSVAIQPSILQSF